MSIKAHASESFGLVAEALIELVDLLRIRSTLKANCAPKQRAVALASEISSQGVCVLRRNPKPAAIARVHRDFVWVQEHLNSVPMLKKEPEDILRVADHYATLRRGDQAIHLRAMAGAELLELHVGVGHVAL